METSMVGSKVRDCWKTPSSSSSCCNGAPKQLPTLDWLHSRGSKSLQRKTSCDKSMLDRDRETPEISYLWLVADSRLDRIEKLWKSNWFDCQMRIDWIWFSNVDFNGDLSPILQWIAPAGSGSSTVQVTVCFIPAREYRHFFGEGVSIKHFQMIGSKLKILYLNLFDQNWNLNWLTNIQSMKLEV